MIAGYEPHPRIPGLDSRERDILMRDAPINSRGYHDRADEQAAGELSTDAAGPEITELAMRQAFDMADASDFDDQGKVK